jgi:hypothetical protein
MVRLGFGSSDTRAFYVSARSVGLAAIYPPNFEGEERATPVAPSAQSALLLDRRRPRRPARQRRASSSSSCATGVARSNLPPPSPGPDRATPVAPSRKARFSHVIGVRGMRLAWEEFCDRPLEFAMTHGRSSRRLRHPRVEFWWAQSGRCIYLLPALHARSR